MPSADLLLTYWPGWLALTIAAVMAFNKFVEESYKFASYFGKWGKKIHARALARHYVDLAAEQFATAVKNAVDTAREEWETEDNEAISSLNTRLGTVSQVTSDQAKHITELLEQDRIKGGYLDYEGLWHNKFRAAAVRSEDGRVSLTDLPVHMGYYEFEAQFRVNPKWREWGGL